MLNIFASVNYLKIMCSLRATGCNHCNFEQKLQFYQCKNIPGLISVL